MDLIFFENPILLLFLFGAVILHILTYIFRKKSISPVLVLLNTALHSAGICVMFLYGADNQDILLYVLISAFLALLQCTRPYTKEGGDK